MNLLCKVHFSVESQKRIEENIKVDEIDDENDLDARQKYQARIS